MMIFLELYVADRRAEGELVLEEEFSLRLDIR